VSDLTLFDLTVAGFVVACWLIGLAVVRPRRHEVEPVSRKELNAAVERERAAGRLT
jgi:hypothetical protein